MVLTSSRRYLLIGKQIDAPTSIKNARKKCWPSQHNAPRIFWAGLVLAKILTSQCRPCGSLCGLETEIACLPQAAMGFETVLCQ